MEYYINRTSVSIEGGYPCYQKNFIELFGIPSLNINELKYLEKENDYVKNLFKKVDEENKKIVKFFAREIGQKIEIDGKRCEG